MFNTASLSLDQAPPISIPFRFFLTAPLFGLLAGILMLLYGPEITSSRWLPATLALTHSVTLGFLTMVMCGALMQMLPVLSGSPLPRVRLIGGLFHLLLAGGTLALIYTFLSYSRVAGWLALILFAVGFLLFMVAWAVALHRVRVRSATITGMRLAGAALLATLLLGFTLLLFRLGVIDLARAGLWVDIHLGWGGLGWIALLLIAVSYQVVPMFHVTPEYPGHMRSWLTRVLFAFLLLWGLARRSDMPAGVADLLMAGLLSGLSLYAGTTLSLIGRKRRKVRDVSLLFWRFSLLSVLAGILLWGYMLLNQDTALEGVEFLLGICVLAAAMTVVNGMLYKIPPFLSWFHLQHRQLAASCFSVTVPHMKAFQPDTPAAVQFYLWLAAVLLIMLSVLIDGRLIYPGAVLFIASNLLLLWNLLCVVRLYRRVGRELANCQPGAV